VTSSSANGHGIACDNAQNPASSATRTASSPAQYHTSRNAGHTSTTSATTHATTSPATMPTSTASHHDVTTEAATNTDGASTAQHTTNATRANRAECRRWTTSTIADDPRPAPPRTVVPLDLNTSYLSLRS